MEFLTKEEIEDFEKAFNMFDNDGSGTISSRELITAMQNLNLRPKEEEIQNIIKHVDDDAGGDIDFHEFLDLMGRKMRDLKKNEEVFNLFRVFDRDRNGYISAQEMKYAMAKLGHPITERQAVDLINEADTGVDGLINYEEFYAKLMDKEDEEYEKLRELEREKEREEEMERKRKEAKEGRRRRRRN